jgi:DNA-binding CsgD family transcriptional regulator
LFADRRPEARHLQYPTARRPIISVPRRQDSMADLADDRIADALDFAARVVGRGTPDDAVQAFCAIAKGFGLPYAACGGWVDTGRGRMTRFFFNTWPEDWSSLYQSEILADDDPVISEARRVMQAFRWSELRSRILPGERGSKTMDIGERYGWREILAVPMHGPSGYHGLLAIAAREEVMLDQASILALEMAGRAIHGRCRAAPSWAGAGATLSPRQLAVLRLVATGMTDGEIARELGVSESTAHFHVEAGKKALQARTRSHAVARLVLMGLL